jgi:hypothetical protein
MNLLCPSCQNQLAVPEHYAGQLMKCPLCGNSFTAPAMPVAAGGPSPALAPEPESHDATPIDLTPTSFSPPPPPPAPAPAADGAEHEVYGVTHEPVHTPPAATVKPPPRPARSSDPVSTPAPASSPPAPRSTPAGYTHTSAFVLKPQVARWIAPACLGLVFVLSFFPWVGTYLGDHAILTQSAWGAAFGGYTQHAPVDKLPTLDKDAPIEKKPGAGMLMIFFLFFGLFPSVLVGAAVAALPFIKNQFRLPPHLAHLARVEQWRWLIVTGVTSVAILLLFLQLVTSFSIEAQVGDALGFLVARRTWYPYLTFLLLVLAVAGAAATQWLETRGPDRPLPRLEVMW